MEIFVGRQPIFSRQKKVIGYELLYRNSDINVYNAMDGDTASFEVMRHSLLTFGLGKLTFHKKAFINFTYNLLMSNLADYLPKEDIVIEILESVTWSQEVINRCKELKKKGFTIAVDDVTEDTLPEELLPFIDIIKIDFLYANEENKRLLARKYKPYSLLLLAEKIEDQQEFEKAFLWGFDLFQGYYFSKPSIISDIDVPTLEGQYLHILNELNKEDSNIDHIASLIEKDVSISYKLLRLVNTVGFSKGIKIQSIKQAILLMGLKELRKWITLLMMTSTVKDEVTKEIFLLSLIRAKVAESIAKKIGQNASEYYLFGLFSVIDAILKKPIPVILQELPLSSFIKKGLQGEEDDLRQLLNLFQDLERGEKNLAYTGGSSAGITNDDLFCLYVKAIKWTNEVSANLS
ncbi:EAL and HDOD domain-containing protein [Heyndrickxia acidicola]|uniref:HDOD domain-containing protein n=1 Tax=Heyndrickxia acidicola TaxID=209389 RepID=A0ABU6MFT1_9BACI|nr:HDOD domain-containing protein [Heyndrickxia acidicola]MED1203268.1 HDOD domain-containing protein [Heyndrickxia acidicola]